MHKIIKCKTFNKKCEFLKFERCGCPDEVTIVFFIKNYPCMQKMSQIYDTAHGFLKMLYRTTHLKKTSKSENGYDKVT